MLAVEDPAESALAAFGSRDPVASGPGRIVTHVLSVAAFEIGDPMAVFIEMKADDAPGSHVRNRLRLL